MHVVERSQDNAGTVEGTGSSTVAISSGMPATVDRAPGLHVDRPERAPTPTGSCGSEPGPERPSAEGAESGGVLEAEQLGRDGAVDPLREPLGRIEAGRPGDALGLVRVDDLDPGVADAGAAGLDLAAENVEQPAGQHPPDPGNEPEPGVGQSQSRSVTPSGTSASAGLIALASTSTWDGPSAMASVSSTTRTGALLAQPARLTVGRAVARADREEVEVGAFGDGLVHDLGPPDDGDRLVVRERQQRAEPAAGAVGLDHP